MNYIKVNCTLCNTENTVEDKDLRKFFKHDCKTRTSKEYLGVTCSKCNKFLEVKS